ncbi:MAG TPA: luciferase family protein [Chloroflexota bacterium]|nr:luciferase family protein [Chloroflexota bacterium]
MGETSGERLLQANSREFLHVHGTSLIHIYLTHEEKPAAITRGDARQHPFAPRRGLFELHLTSEAHLPTARRLATFGLHHIAHRHPLPTP